ncbi:MAG: DUF5688 family protein [Lachnospiraceae bacterium]|nr:DUF5688 family protein [Lachnospiraceae bacterium]
MEEFIEKLRAVLQDRFPTKQILVNNTTKVNDVTRAGIIIRDDNCMLSPILYCDGYYGNYVEGRTLSDIADEIVRLYNELPDDRPCVTEELLDFEYVRDKVRIKLVNKEKNADFLKGKPNRDFLDLAVVYYVDVSCDEDDQLIYAFTIDNRLLSRWEMTESELYEVAYDNTLRKSQFVIKDIIDYVGHMFPCGSLGEDERGFMYVASNKKLNYGAVYLLFEDNLKSFADELKSDLIILPSSVHEVLILRNREDRENLKEMVSVVNRDNVSLTEYLSDSVYIYDREKRELSFLS